MGQWATRRAYQPSCMLTYTGSFWDVPVTLFSDSTCLAPGRHWLLTHGYFPTQRPVPVHHAWGEGTTVWQCLICNFSSTSRIHVLRISSEHDWKVSSIKCINHKGVVLVLVFSIPNLFYSSQFFLLYICSKESTQFRQSLYCRKFATDRQQCCE